MRFFIIQLGRATNTTLEEPQGCVLRAANGNVPQIWRHRGRQYLAVGERDRENKAGKETVVRGKSAEEGGSKKVDELKNQ